MEVRSRLAPTRDREAHEVDAVRLKDGKLGQRESTIFFLNARSTLNAFQLSNVLLCGAGKPPSSYVVVTHLSQSLQKVLIRPGRPIVEITILMSEDPSPACLRTGGKAV